MGHMGRVVTSWPGGGGLLGRVVVESWPEVVGWAVVGGVWWALKVKEWGGGAGGVDNTTTKLRQT